jgi:hypothetical protein
MYTFVFNQWVLLGGPVPVDLSLSKAHFLDVGKRNGFMAATYPRQPFMIEPPVQKMNDEHLLHKSQPAVGEYELFLYEGEATPFQWSAKEWEGWIMLASQRLLQLHHNPFVHHVSLSMHTGAFASVAGYQRIGDLIGTSHQISGAPAIITTELAEKIREKEAMFVVEETKFGGVYVPPAPLHSRELWYLPTGTHSGFEQIEPAERTALAKVLSVLFPALNAEFPDMHFMLSIHSNIAGMAEDATWWLQLHQVDSPNSLALQTRALPESFAQHLHFMLGHAD